MVDEQKTLHKLRKLHSSTNLTEQVANKNFTPRVDLNLFQKQKEKGTQAQKAEQQILVQQEL